MSLLLLGQINIASTWHQEQPTLINSSMMTAALSTGTVAVQVGTVHDSRMPALMRQSAHSSYARNNAAHNVHRRAMQAAKGAKSRNRMVQWQLTYSLTCITLPGH